MPIFFLFIYNPKHISQNERSGSSKMIAYNLVLEALLRNTFSIYDLNAFLYCRFCRNVLPSDIAIEIEDVFFHLHKFPLLSKCGKIARIVGDSKNEKEDVYHIIGCPGGPDGFYLVAQFCYGITVELTPKNILMVCSAAEYLEMTEEFGEGNLLAMTESFIHKDILRSWKNCILALQSAQHSIFKAETLPIVSKCLNSLSTMVCTDLSLFGWPMMMYGSLQSPGGSILWNGINTGARIRSSVSDWWFEDISGLSVPMFHKLMEIMDKRGVRSENIASALMYYAKKHLPGLDRWQSFSLVPSVDPKDLLEKITVLLPEKKGKSYCRFLLGLLRIASILNACKPCKDSLERKIGMQLELATLDDLLIPSFSDSYNLYDTDCIERIVRYFLSSQASCIPPFSPSSDPELSPSSSPLSTVTKLIDSYLVEIAPDVNLTPEKMRCLLVALPESLRSLDDGLYRALDVYFKAHPWLSHNERENLCSIINCGKLSIDACSHASQNDRLPLRFVLQVLFFEQLQLRTTISNCLNGLEGDSAPTNTANDTVGTIVQRDGWVSLIQQNRYLKVDMERMRSRVRQLERELTNIKHDMGSTGRSHGLTRSKSRTLWCVPLLPGASDASPAIIQSTGPSPRRSSAGSHISRT
ncbi:BTB/POZ domain-containing protein At3g44820 isoform X1 [Asparagus officinalis]|uniref:BTB/POZ domain-containing protein At3g44820 isoform X1 n=1 Tax=Asparagus officinalis TaxID=4686 RepID=UPI00098E57F1|nr:BTB/POZ domain-containing protein At3g44820 isoform X1 [Asparagus officinalis]